MAVHQDRPVPNTEQPMTLLGVLDTALEVVRARPRTVIGILAVFILPIQLIIAFSQRRIFDAFNLDAISSGEDPFAPGSPGAEAFEVSPFDFSSFLTLLILPFVGYALTHLVLGWRNGEERTLGQCLAATFAKTHLLLAAFVICKLVQVFTLMFGTVATALVAPVMAAEGLGPVAAMRRSWALAMKRFGPLLGLQLLHFLVQMLLSQALTTLPLVGGFLLADWGWIAFFGLGIVGTAVSTVLAVGVAVIAYFDTRNRTEGLDLTVRARRAVHAAGMR